MNFSKGLSVLLKYFFCLEMEITLLVRFIHKIVKKSCVSFSNFVHHLIHQKLTNFYIVLVLLVNHFLLSFPDHSFFNFPSSFFHFILFPLLIFTNAIKINLHLIKLELVFHFVFKVNLNLRKLLGIYHFKQILKTFLIVVPWY